MLIAKILKKIVFYFFQICQISILWKTWLQSTKICVHVYYHRKCWNAYLHPFTFFKFFSQTEEDFVSSHEIVYRMLWWTTTLTLHTCRYYIYWILGTRFVFPLWCNCCHKILKHVQLHLKKSPVLVSCFPVQISIQFVIVRSKDVEWAFLKIFPFKRRWSLSILSPVFPYTNYAWSNSFNSRDGLIKATLTAS